MAPRDKQTRLLLKAVGQAVREARDELGVSQEELGFESDLPYEILTGKVHPWSFDVAQNRYLDVAEPLRQAMHKNPHLKVFVANGYYDMATPYFATEHTFSHLGLDASLEGNVSMAYYPAGHMMYVHEPSLARLKADLVGFFGDAVGA